MLMDTNGNTKKLLIKDLSSRLPYNVIVDYAYNAFDVRNGNYVKHGSKCILNCYLLDVFISPRQNEKGEYIKPYLFPLSSMTEEQKKYITDKWSINEEFNFEIDTNWGEYFVELGDTVDFINWLNENHFDYRGLIEKGLAIDATVLNIY